MYELVDYARGRLEGTVIRINSVPSMVSEVTEDREIRYRNLRTKERDWISLDSSAVDLTPIQVGYANFKDGATYFIRMAQRRWKQGIDAAGVGTIGPDYRNMDERLFDTDSMLDCMDNKYPTLEGAMTMATLHDISVAFHRKWAVSPQGIVMYRGREVGGYDGTLRLDHVNKYLAEVLEESL